MNESTLILVSFIKDLMIITSLGILIILLLALVILAVYLIGPFKSLKRAANNVEETSILIRSSANDISKSLSFFSSISGMVERVKSRVNRSSEQ